MHKYTFRALAAVAAALLLAACGPSEEDKAKAAEAAAKADAAAKEAAALVLPAQTDDEKRWKDYFKAALTKFLHENPTIKTSHLYSYYVQSGDGDDAKTARAAQLDDLKTVVARGGVAGNLMAFVGPDSKTTADTLIEAFKDSKDGAFKGVFVVYVGKSDDDARVKEALTKSAADYKFVELK